MPTLFSFGINLFNRLCFKRKFSLLAIVTLIPLMIGACWIVEQQLHERGILVNKLDGKQKIEQLRPLQTKILNLRDSLNVNKGQLRSTLSFWQISSFKYPRSQIQYIELESAISTFSGSTDDITQLSNLLSEFKKAIAAESGLTLDSDPQDFYFANLYINRIPDVIEFSSLDIQVAKNILTAQRFTPETYTQLVAVNKRLSELLLLQDKQAQKLSEVLSHNSNWLSAAKKAKQSTQTLIERIQNSLIEPDSFQITLSEFNSLVRVQQKSIFELDKLASDLLSQSLRSKVELQQNHMYFVVSFVSFVVLLSLYFFFSAYKAISQNIASIHKATTLVADGDLTADLAVQGKDEFNEIAGAFNQMLGNMRELISGVQELSHEVVDASQKVQTATMDVETNLTNQQQETHVVATAVSQLAASVNTVDQNTQQATSITVSAQEDVDQGQKVILSTVEGINHIAQEVQAGAEAINQLAQHADDIGKVVDVIHEIAEQTNLLALNAAIEAARAGEQGRGFAVVADEVRTLASRTASSTDEIRRMIELVQSATSKAVETMNSGSKQANEGVEQANEVSETIANVTRRVSEVVQLSAQIADIVSEQRQATTQVDENTQAIESGATVALKSAQSASQVGKLLAIDAKKLSEQISGFRL
ncbi:methyl-accepting chemotaxis protein [Shewanella sp. 202IG2-18]|uniref:methyl-accepting chemotaxis protein n=1 Tax=Parashewanella hymeniacidonis TaxID=2807618 RepID=UPI001961AF92|nr:methyl-accepting chemotaxis protein [Parashewanella hymeniacidonis]MBM7073656.1 methyl-accepting chemotaxis protein [Parashewanella hymeniacidonis]